MPCPNCATRNADAAIYCKGCGVRIAPVRDERASPDDAREPEPTTRVVASRSAAPQEEASASADALDSREFLRERLRVLTEQNVGEGEEVAELRELLRERLRVLTEQNEGEGASESRELLHERLRVLTGQNEGADAPESRRLKRERLAALQKQQAARSKKAILDAVSQSAGIAPEQVVSISVRLSDGQTILISSDHGLNSSQERL